MGVYWIFQNGDQGAKKRAFVQMAIQGWFGVERLTILSPIFLVKYGHSGEDMSFRI